MKKIKAQLKKTPIKTTPHLALLILAEQRYKMLNLMLAWYEELREQLTDELQISIHVASVEDLELDALLQERGGAAVRVVTRSAKPQGERNNDALLSLKGSDAHAVLPLLPGDLLSASLLSTYATQLKEGVLFSGLLDTYIFDPTEFKFMYWAQHRFESHPSRVAPLGYMISRGLLDALKWRLWPNQVKPADGFHKVVLDRLNQGFQHAPQGSCVSQSLEVLGGKAISLKSELARALYEEGNWQKLQGLSYRSFETEVEGHISEGWVERLNSFDERIKLEILVEEPDEGAPAIWKTHYDFCVYKFLPYADVRLRLISSPDSGALPEGWSRLECDAPTQSERHQQALTQLKSQGGDLFLFGGKGGLVDLKTIEHYLIHATRNNAKLLACQNFFIADLESNQLYFWPGATSGHFTEMFGFGACVHRSHLDKCDWSVFGPEGLQEGARAALTELATSPETRQQTVFFKCAGHKLGVIAMGLDELFGFNDLVRLSDLKPVSLEKLPPESFDGNAKALLIAWTRGVNADFSEDSSAELASDPVLKNNKESDMSTLSPLERAKQLLSQGAAPAQAPSNISEPSAEKAENLSPLERAKSLLAKGQASSSAPQAAEVSSKEQPSPLERAKALLSKNQQAEASASSAPAAEATSTGVTSKLEEKQLSPLERAKALLAQVESAPSPEAPEATEEPTVNTEEMIQTAIQDAEGVVAQLTARRDAALKAVQEATKQEGRVENPAATLLCEQGEVAFGEGDIQKAAQLFESALVIDGDSIRALSNLGVVAMHAEHPWQALSYLLLALIKDHEDENVVANLQGLVSSYPELSVAQTLFV